jgi:hypothetical protein
VININNWIELTESEYDTVWNRVEDELEFKRSFIVPTPYFIYDISTYLNWSGDIEEFEEIYKELEEKSLFTFRKVTNKDEYFYALDWQHPCYWVNPFLEFPRDEFDEWTIPIFPNGDFYFFIQKDFNWGFLGHPWEQTITVFGQEFIQALEKNSPRMFNSILRKG